MSIFGGIFGGKGAKNLFRPSLGGGAKNLFKPSIGRKNIKKITSPFFGSKAYNHLFKASMGGKNVKKLWSPSGKFIGKGLFGASGKYLGKASLLGAAGVFGGGSGFSIAQILKNKKLKGGIKRDSSASSGGGGIYVKEAIVGAQAMNPRQIEREERIENKQLTKEEIKDKLRTDIMNDLALAVPETPKEKPMSTGAKIGFGMAAVVVLFGMGYVLFKGGKKNKGRLPRRNRR